MGSFLSCAVSTSILSGPLGQRTAIRSAERKGTDNLTLNCHAYFAFLLFEKLFLPQNDIYRY